VSQAIGGSGSVAMYGDGSLVLQLGVRLEDTEQHYCPIEKAGNRFKYCVSKALHQ